MTITFHCPKCDALCAFDDKYAGRRAKCLKCRQLFIIPASSADKIVTVVSQEPMQEPLPGFYEALFKKSWKVFTGNDSAAWLGLMGLLVCANFFLGQLNFQMTIQGRGSPIQIILPFGYLTNIIVWGFLFWCYMEIIRWTTLDMDEFPSVGLKLGSTAFLNIAKSMYMFFITMLVVQLPYLASVGILKMLGLNLSVISYALMFCGFFIFVFMFMMVAIKHDIMMAVRFDLIIEPLKKAFRPYALTAGIFAVLCAVQLMIPDYENSRDKSFVFTALSLFAHIAVQAAAIISMRTIGLFYRHYNCYLPW